MRSTGSTLGEVIVARGWDATLPTAVTWSVLVERLDTHRTLFDHQPDTVCASASIGKILLLLTVAEAVAGDQLDPHLTLSRHDVEPVGDSGQWQHLATDALPLVDVCALVGATSDNLATNVLIHHVGLDAVAGCASRLGLMRTGMHDIVRDTRGRDHPPALSTGSARELVALCAELSEPRAVDPAAAAAVVGWLSTNTDLSMVAGAFGLDPLAHGFVDRGIGLWNKTGTNVGVRCDVGVVDVDGRPAAYAALANWRADEPLDPTRDAVLDAMRSLGRQIISELRTGDR